MDRSVEAEAPLLSPQDVPALTFERRVLEDGLGKQPGRSAVEPRIGLGVDRSAAVVGLEVEHANTVGRGEPLHERPVPVVLGIELELELGVVREPGERVGPRRDDEAHIVIVAPDRRAE